MRLRTPKSTPTDTLFPYTSLFRSHYTVGRRAQCSCRYGNTDQRYERRQEIARQQMTDTDNPVAPIGILPPRYEVSANSCLGDSGKVHMTLSVMGERHRRPARPSGRARQVIYSSKNGSAACRERVVQ